MQTLGVGLIGFGFIGKVHTHCYRSLPLFYDPPAAQVRLVGVAVSTAARAAQAARQGGFEFGTDDWRELIEREDIHIINVCSPNRLHAEQVLAALAAGKHLYCEKPLVVEAAEAARIEAALAGYRGTAQMTLQNRFFPATLRARQLVQGGFVGQVTSFRAAYLHSGSVDPARPMGWKQLRSEGGGVLQDLGSHVVDLVDHLVGPIVEVMAETRILYPERPGPGGERIPVAADDQALLLARLAGGAVGTIEASKIATGAEDELRIEIHGDRGALRFNSMQPNYLEAYDLGQPEAPLGGLRGWNRIATVQRYEKPAGFPGPKFSLGWIRTHMQCLHSFLEAVAAGREGEPSLRRGLELQRMLAEAEASARQRQWRSLR